MIYGRDAGVGHGLGLGGGVPPALLTLISTELVVVEPVYTPTATAMSPTKIPVPARIESGRFRFGTLVQVSLGGS